MQDLSTLKHLLKTNKFYTFIAFYAILLDMEVI